MRQSVTPTKWQVWMAKAKFERWTMCRECRLLFKLDEDPDKAAHQVEQRLCPMHDTLGYIASLAVLSLPAGPPAKGTTWT